MEAELDSKFMFAFRNFNENCSLTIIQYQAM